MIQQQADKWQVAGEDCLLKGALAPPDTEFGVCTAADEELRNLIRVSSAPCYHQRGPTLTRAQIWLRAGIQERLCLLQIVGGVHQGRPALFVLHVRVGT